MLLEAGLIEKGYVKGVFSRKLLNKALLGLKDAYWTLVEEKNVQICLQALHDLIQT